MLPLGLLYVGATVERRRHRVKVIDPYLDDATLVAFDRNFSSVNKVIEKFVPAVVGYGGIATSYGRTKRLSLYIRERHPEIRQVVGGALASTYDLLLTKTAVGTVFHGETETSLPIFLERLGRGESTEGIEGTSHRSGFAVVRNNPVEQVLDLDTIPFPAYHLIDVQRYLRASDAMGMGYLPIVASRGCTNRCSFCYRHVQGIRRHSVGYVIRHIKYLKDTYGISGFQFCDELFNSDYDWVMTLCNAIQEAGLNISYKVSGARADKVDRQMLLRLKETGCVEVDYGQESGSDSILKEYHKGVAAERNREITLLTKEVGLANTVQLVIGSPGETTSTVRETIRFLKDVDAQEFSLNYLIPLPGAPIWQYVKEQGLVMDTEAYLDRIADVGGTQPIINLTRQPDKVWGGWSRLVVAEMQLYRLRRSRLQRYIFRDRRLLGRLLDAVVPRSVRQLVPKRIKARL